jgi:DNA (cytosine-5)-methyltransferase 1
LVLSLFPGIDLLGAAFERVGFTVVRGPDILFGGDIRGWQCPAGKFDGVIGGPPCQVFSEATRMNGTDAIDMIPEFVRIVSDARPAWSVMENVTGAGCSYAIPDYWKRVTLNDWDCGGLTMRERSFWSWPFAIDTPPVRENREQAEWSLMASSWKVRTGIKNGGSLGMHRTMTIEKAQELQGFTLPAGSVAKHSKRLAIHMLGNGVPLAMGTHVALQVLAKTRKAA